MELSKNVFKPKEDLKESLMERGTSNVVSYLKTESFKSIELCLVAPYFAESKDWLNSHRHEHKKWSNDIQDKLEDYLTPVFQSLQVKLPDPSMIRRFSTSEYKIYEDTYDQSSAFMISQMEEKIASNAEIGIFVLFVIKADWMRNIPYQGIHFVNYVIV